MNLLTCVLFGFKEIQIDWKYGYQYVTMIAFDYYLNVIILSMFCLNKLLTEMFKESHCLGSSYTSIYLPWKNKFKYQVIKFHVNLGKALKKSPDT